MRPAIAILLLSSACAVATSTAGESTPAAVSARPELEHAVVVLEREVALRAQPAAMALLAVACERTERLDRARDLLRRLDGEVLPEGIDEMLALTQARLDARARGEPRVDDPALEHRVVASARQIEAHAEQLRRGTVHEGDGSP